MAEAMMRRIAGMIQKSGAKSTAEMNARLKSSVIGRSLEDLSSAEPSNNRERAMDLCYSAQGQRSRRELQMIREALRLDPDCAEAYLTLGMRESDPAEAQRYYRQAVDAGRRTLGAEAFEVPGYPFWGAVESRPFMRAMGALADSLEVQGKLEEAADVLAEMLRLKPGEDEGMRYMYVALLLELGRLDAALELME